MLKKTVDLIHTPAGRLRTKFFRGGGKMGPDKRTVGKKDSTNKGQWKNG
jgi:hypothetical protein